MAKAKYLVQRAFRFSIGLLQKIEKTALETGKSQNQIVNEALEEYFKRHDTE